MRPFPGPGGRWQISVDGGAEPRWSPTGREIFFRNGDKMMAAAVRTAPVFSVGERVELFEGSYLTGLVNREYDVSRDGQSFVMVRVDQQSEELVVVLNWFEQQRASGGSRPRAGS